MFGTEALGFTSVGPIAVLGSAMIAALHWKKEHPHDDERIGSLAFKGILIIAIGLVFRTLAAFCATFCSGFKLKEQIFIAFAWIPKATVQVFFAALSPIVLDMAEHESNQNAEHLWEGRVILSVGVLSILISAPLGSFLIHILAPLLLTKDVDAQSDTTKPSPSSTSASQKLSSQKSLTNLSNATNETTLSISGSSKSNSEFQNGSDEYDDAKVLE
ncbi:unnamed protein product [Anisakis simplex]|uniref:Na_H_Exchanger domain-containing protein n=1 Tax=Anisakis simplex TaxID=6269 RepID=A0A0M3KH47_ANISI|nr:unnamed protein product [Anisakis simplex]